MQAFTRKGWMKTKYFWSSISVFFILYVLTVVPTYLILYPISEVAFFGILAVFTVLLIAISIRTGMINNKVFMCECGNLVIKTRKENFCSICGNLIESKPIYYKKVNIPNDFFIEDN